jgi:hypothetical protein
MAVMALALAWHASAQNGSTSFARQAQSSFASHTGPKGDFFRIVNTTFEVAEVSIDDPRQAERLLLEQRLVSDQNWETDSATPNLTVTARLIAKGRSAVPLWSFHESADRGETWSNYYRTTVLGGEGGEDLVRYHELKTGRLLFLATTDPVFVRLANSTSEPRVVTYVSNKTGDEFAFTHRTPNAFGVLTMRQGARVIDQLVLVSTEPTVDGWSPKITGVDHAGHDRHVAEGAQELTLFEREGRSEREAWSDFDLSLHFDQDTDKPLIIVPVEGGRFAIDKATLSRGVSLRRDMPERATATDP